MQAYIRLNWLAYSIRSVSKLRRCGNVVCMDNKELCYVNTTKACLLIDQDTDGYTADIRHV